MHMPGLIIIFTIFVGVLIYCLNLIHDLWYSSYKYFKLVDSSLSKNQVHIYYLLMLMSQGSHINSDSLCNQIGTHIN